MSTYMPIDLLPPRQNWEANSTRRLSRIEMQKAISKVKRFVERRLESDLNVFEVSVIVLSNNISLVYFLCGII